jgi:hypothetical protein
MLLAKHGTTAEILKLLTELSDCVADIKSYVVLLSYRIHWLAIVL